MRLVEICRIILVTAFELNIAASAGTKVALTSYGKGGSPGTFVMDLKWEWEKPPATTVALEDVVTVGAETEGRGIWGSRWNH